MKLKIDDFLRVFLIEGNLEVKLPTIWKDEKQSREVRRKKIQVRERQKKEDTLARTVRKVENRYVFPMACGLVASKSRLAKAAGAEPCGQRRNEKLHAAVARSALASQNVQNTPCSDNFWEFRCQRIARRCGPKHMCKSKCSKHTGFGPLLEVTISKNGTPLWHEANLQVKMFKTHQLPTTFGSYDVEKWHAATASQNAKSTTVLGLFARDRCQKRSYIHRYIAR